MLVHQLPPKPGYLRVKVWRRLQALGAVSVRNAALCAAGGSEAQEDFEWLLHEIREGGGEALVCEARLIDGLTDQEVQALFDPARDADYHAVAKEARALAKASEAQGATSAAPDAKARLSKLRARFAQVHAIDFFGADGRETVDGAEVGVAAPRTRTPGEAMPAANQAEGR